MRGKKLIPFFPRWFILFPRKRSSCESSYSFLSCLDRLKAEFLWGDHEGCCKLRSFFTRLRIRTNGMNAFLRWRIQLMLRLIKLTEFFNSWTSKSWYTYQQFSKVGRLTTWNSKWKNSMQYLSQETEEEIISFEGSRGLLWTSTAFFRRQINLERQKCRKFSIGSFQNIQEYNKAKITKKSCWKYR